MQTFYYPSEWQTIKTYFNASDTIGFVPTMGNLHVGHLSLLEKAREENTVTVLSIFINPTQFNEKEDFLHYPKTLEADLALAEKAKVNYVFIPEIPSLYPDDYAFRITKSDCNTLLEGRSRPGHFEGVLTIVMKLLQIIQADRAYFGEKDYEQYEIIREMTEAFFLNTKIIPCPTIREPSGLAYSSRNNRLSEQGRLKAAHFYNYLKLNENSERIQKKLEDLGFQVDYIAEKAERRYGAIYHEGIRLIDNIDLKEML